MKATTTLVLYTEQKIIAEVFEGESYLTPEDVMVFEGDLEAFKIVHPDISEQDDKTGF